jgi:hypothetical protein
VSIATLAQLKAYLDLQLADAQRDVYLQSLLDGMTVRVERYTGRRFAPDPALVAGDPPTDTAAPVTKTLHPERTTGRDIWPSQYSRVVRIPDVREIDSVVLDGTTVDPDDYTLRGSDPLGLDPPYWQIKLESYGRELQITGRFGFWPVPDDVTDAFLTACARRYHERKASFADQVQAGDGSLTNYFKQFPAFVLSTLNDYRLAGA